MKRIFIVMVALMLSSVVLYVGQSSSATSSLNPAPLFIMGITLIVVSILGRSEDVRKICSTVGEH